MSTLVCVGDTLAGRHGKLVGECLLWAGGAEGCDCWPGEALHREDGSRIVVDLGEAGGGAGDVAAEFDPHLLILTHSDRDHIGGAASFFATDTTGLEEMWVPYEWGLLAKTLAAWFGLGHSTPGTISIEVEHVRWVGANADEAETPLPGAQPLDESIAEGEVEFDQLPEVDAAERWGRLRAHIGANRDRLIEEIASVLERERQRNADWPPVPEPEDTVKIANDVVKKFGSVVTILTAAAETGARVRYFSTDGVRSDPQPWLSSGRPGVASIVNAVEVCLTYSAIEDPPLVAYLLAQLTVQNRRALMPLLWDRGSAECCWYDLAHMHREHRDYWYQTDREREPCKPWGVLISSDSSGESARVNLGYASTLVPWEHLTAMTAPHPRFTRPGA